MSDKYFVYESYNGHRTELTAEELLTSHAVNHSVAERTVVVLFENGLITDKQVLKLLGHPRGVTTIINPYG